MGGALGRREEYADIVGNMGGAYDNEHNSQVQVICFVTGPMLF